MLFRSITSRLTIETDGNDSSEEENSRASCQSAPVVVTNLEGRRSHLAAGVGPTCNHGEDVNTAAAPTTEIRVMYSILSLENNVYIYPILTSDSDPETAPLVGKERQLVDFTTIVGPIRNKTGQKYVPTLEETSDGHLVVRVSSLPGQVIIVGGAGLASQIQFLLHAVLMVAVATSEGVSDGTPGPRAWALVPKPLDRKSVV